MNKKLLDYGFNGLFASLANGKTDLFPARIISQSKDIYKAVTNTGEIYAKVLGKMRHDAVNAIDLPVVGDFVMLDREDKSTGNAVIINILDRKSCIVRKAAGTSNTSQPIASNVDMAFICMALNNDFNSRRLERYLSVVWNGNCQPVVILTKSDLCFDTQSRLDEVKSIALGVDIIVTSSVLNENINEVRSYIKKGDTIVFIGSSGVGKSTLINLLLDKQVMRTNGLRDDDKGRHTTTSRELFLLPGGGIVIDTPGMRELGLDSASLEKTFVDIEELSKNCRFRNCTHKSEPGCAVLQAICDGSISADRFTSFEKLKQETKYEGLNHKQIESEKLKNMFSDFGSLKNARNYMKGKNKSKKR